MTTPVDPHNLIDTHTLVFDPADKANGSLYLAIPSSTPGTLDLPASLRALRSAGLWSAEPEKTVPDAHKPAYKEQMLFVEAVSYQCAGGVFTIARFDHPKFPSDAARWDAWKTHFDQHHPRA